MEYRNEGVWGQTWERGSEAYRSSSYLKYQEAIRGSTRIVNPLSQTGFSSAPKLRTKERLLRDSEPNHWLRLAKPERMTETPRETAHAGYRTQGWVRQRPITNQLSSTSAGFRPLESHLEDPNKQILELNKKVDGLATQFQTMTAILLDYNKLGYHPEMPPQNHLMGRTSLSTGSRRPYLEHDEKSAHYSIHPEPPLAYMSVSKATSDNGMFLKTQIQHSQDKLSRTNIRPVSRGGLSSVSTPNSIGGKKPPSHSGVSVVGERSTSNNFFKPAEFAEDRIKKPATNLDSSPPSKSGSSQNIDAMGPQQLRELRDKIDQRLRTASEINESEKSSVQQRPGSSTSSITQFKGSIPAPQSKTIGGPNGNLTDQIYSVYHGQPVIKPSSQMISVMGPKPITQLTPKRLSQKGMPPKPMRSPKQAVSEMAGQSPKSELKGEQLHSGSASTELHTGGHNNEKETTSSGSHSQGYEESDRSILEIQASIQKELQDGPQNNPILMLRAFAKPPKGSSLVKQALGGDRDTEDEASPVLGDIRVELSSPNKSAEGVAGVQRPHKGFFQPTAPESRGVELANRKQTHSGNSSQNARPGPAQDPKPPQTTLPVQKVARNGALRLQDSAAKGGNQLK